MEKQKNNKKGQKWKIEKLLSDLRLFLQSKIFWTIEFKNRSNTKKVLVTISSQKFDAEIDRLKQIKLQVPWFCLPGQLKLPTFVLPKDFFSDGLIKQCNK